MIPFEKTINIYMIGEMVTAIALYALSAIVTGAIVLAKEDTRKYLTMIVIAILVMATATLWHSVSWRHADNVQNILREAYKHPTLWKANP